jgi:hypothetical protein
MSTDIAELDQQWLTTAALAPADRRCLERVAQSLPAVRAELAVVGGRSKTDLQLETVDVADMHPMRSLRHTLAQIQRRLDALQEATFERRLRLAKADEFEAKGTAVGRIKAEQLRAQVPMIERGMVGAVRDLAALFRLRDEVLAALNTDTLTAEAIADYESEAQIMICLSQCLTAARASGGRIDHGNLIYCQQIGLNGGMVQHCIIEYLMAETTAISKGNIVSFQAEVTFLRELTAKFAGCPQQRRSILNQRKEIAP